MDLLSITGCAAAAFSSMSAHVTGIFSVSVLDDVEYNLPSDCMSLAFRAVISSRCACRIDVEFCDALSVLPTLVEELHSGKLGGDLDALAGSFFAVPGTGTSMCFDNAGDPLDVINEASILPRTAGSFDLGVVAGFFGFEATVDFFGFSVFDFFPVDLPLFSVLVVSSAVRSAVAGVDFFAFVFVVIAESLKGAVSGSGLADAALEPDVLHWHTLKYVWRQVSSIHLSVGAFDFVKELDTLAEAAAAAALEDLLI